MTGTGGASGDGNNPDNGNGGGGNSDAAAQVLSALSEQNRQLAVNKGWDKGDINRVFDSYREAESTIGKLRSGPTGLNSPADYEFKLPQGIPQDGFYDKTFAETFKNWSHAAKLTKEQAQVIHDKYTLNAAELFKTHNTQTQQQFDAAVAAASGSLEKAWGSPESPGHKRATEMGRRAINHLDPGLKEALTLHGVIAKNAKGEEVVVNAPIFQALSKAGAQMFSEDTVFGTPAASENPFDPKTENLQKQGQLIQQNPELAKTLIQAAGPKVAEAWSWWTNKK